MQLVTQTFSTCCSGLNWFFSTSKKEKRETDRVKYDDRVAIAVQVRLEKKEGKVQTAQGQTAAKPLSLRGIKFSDAYDESGLHRSIEVRSVCSAEQIESLFMQPDASYSLILNSEAVTQLSEFTRHIKTTKLLHIDSFPNMQRVGREKQLTNRDFLEFASANPSLQELHLWACGGGRKVDPKSSSALTVDGVKEALQYMPNLKTLDLAQNIFLVREISGSLTTTNIETLKLTSNDIPFTYASLVQNLSCMKSLKTVHILKTALYCTATYNKFRKALQAKMPHLEIVEHDLPRWLKMLYAATAVFGCAVNAFSCCLRRQD
jgi:hypothetical protein